jgi:predicted chitinase
MKNAAAFFDAVRKAPFNGSLTLAQVDGINALLRSCARNRVTDDRHVANIMAQVFHETGSYMLPIKETVFASHKDKNPSDATVIARLNKAWAAGKLPWVKAPYWRDGWFGRGPIQLTHRENYEKMGRRLGVDLVKNRDLALDPEIGADIAVVGMAEGMFRAGHRLSTYFNATRDDPVNARSIVNGPDGNYAKVAGYHRSFLTAIRAGGGFDHTAPQPPAHPPAGPIPVPDLPAPDGSFVAKVIAAIVAATVAAAAYFLTR